MHRHERDGTVAESFDEVRDEIRHERRDLAGSINELETRVRERFDLRRYIEERPMDLAIIALGAGLLLASRNSSSRRVPEKREMNETFEFTKAALLAVGRKQARALIDGAKAGASRQ
jgi:hypothetical protein